MSGMNFKLAIRRLRVAYGSIPVFFWFVNSGTSPLSYPLVM
jgi:hypothetical protein